MNLLSASQLQKIFSTEGGVPLKGGQKDYAPDGSWLHQQKLVVFHEERVDVLGQERVRTLGSLIKGEWIPGEGRVQLPKHGKFAKYMGYTENCKQYLLPEETMYLLDEASIEVYFQGTPISIQEALSVILIPYISLEQYQVFSYFSRIGYILRRHRKPTSESYEEKINLQKYSKTEKRFKGKRRKDAQDSNSINSKKSKFTYSQHDKSSVNQIPSSENEHSDGNNVMSSTSSMNNVSEASCSHHTITSINSCDSENSDEKMASDIYTKEANDKYLQENMNEQGIDESFYGTLPYSSWDYCQINFPDIGRLKQFKVSSNISSLLPPTLHLESKEYDLSQYRKKRRGRRFADLEFSCGSSGCKAKRQAKNWAEYKAQMAAVHDDEVLLTSPVGHLWEGDVKPLIKPQEAINTDHVLQKLNVIKKLKNFNDSIQAGSNIQKEYTLEIVYDGYEPSSKFKKTNPGKPKFRLVIMRQEDPPPSLNEICQLYKESVAVDGVPIYCAVVDSGDIAFYSMNIVELPKDISMG